MSSDRSGLDIRLMWCLTLFDGKTRTNGLQGAEETWVAPECGVPEAL